MKKLIQTLFASAFIVALAPQVFAQGRRGTYSPGTSAYGSSIAYGYNNEIITNFTSGTLISGKACANCSSVTSIQLQAAYLRTMNANVQAGGWVNINNTGSDTLFTLVGLGVYNFETDFKNSFFAQGGLGIYPVPKSIGPGYESKFGFMIGAGKRFPLWDRVNYIPTLSLEKRGDLDISFVIQLINFSIMF